MRYLDTRRKAPEAYFRDVLLAGTAPGGGLYVPKTYPLVDMGLVRTWTYAQLATHILYHYVSSVISFEDLDEITHAVYTAKNFGTDAITPICWLEDDNFGLLELANGPTLAFKDLPMMVVAKLIEYVLGREGRRATVIVSTSGDTGGAAVEAFAGLKNVDLVVLFPKGKVSSVQQRIMTTSGASNVHALALEGTFDDCQDVVKVLFEDDDLVARYMLSAVNSINWTRIAAQMVYWFFCGVQVLNRGNECFDAVVPSGNSGNIFSLDGARRMGLPVGKIVVATNKNTVLWRVFRKGVYRKGVVIPSKSPSMDIQVSSNLERLAFEDSGRDGEYVARRWAEFKETGTCDMHSLKEKWKDGWNTGYAREKAVLATIRRVSQVYGRDIDPHTAVGVDVAWQLYGENISHQRQGMKRPVIVAETARPEKFPEAMTLALGKPLPLPLAWANLANLPEKVDDIGNDAREVKQYIIDHVCK